MERRDIKFRAWDDLVGKMLYNVNINQGHPVKRGYQSFSKENTVYHSQPLQYTGLKDKNGKEIYEGDILRIRLNPETIQNFKVVWNDGYRVIREDTFYYRLSQVSNECEIIGNIYENPELI